MGIVAASIHFETTTSDVVEQIKTFLGRRGYRAEKDAPLRSAETAVDEDFAGETVKNIRQKRLRSFVIMPPSKGWVTVVEDGCSSIGDQDLAATLAGRLGCRVAYVVISDQSRSILYALYQGGDDVESLWMVEGAVTETHGLPGEVTAAADIGSALKMHLGKLGLRRLAYRYEDFRDAAFEPVEMKAADCRHLSLSRAAGVTETQQIPALAGGEEEAALRKRAEEFYRKYVMSDAHGMYRMEVPVLSLVGDLNSLDKYVRAVRERIPRADEVRIDEVSFEDAELRTAKLKCTFLKDGEVVRVKCESWQKGALYAFVPALKSADHGTWFHNIQARGEYE